MRMHLILVFLIILPVFDISQAQTSTLNQSIRSDTYLDSLLLINNFSKVKQVLNECISAGNKRTNQNMDSENYLRLINRIESIQSNEEEKLINYIENFTDQQDNFKIELVGKKSNRAYINYILAKQDNDFLDAASELQLAIFFKNKFVNALNDEAKHYFKMASETYNLQDLESSMFYLESYNKIVNTNPYLSSLKDSLIIKSQTLKQNILKSKFWKAEKEKPNAMEKIYFTYSYSLNKSNDLWYKKWPYGLNIKVLRNYYDDSHKLCLGYFIKSNLCVVVQSNFGNLEYSIPSINYEYISKDKYHVNFIMNSLNIQYYLNKRIGLRPFIELGFGYSNYELKIAEEKKIWYGYILDNKDKTNSSFFIPGNIGLKYFFKYPKFIAGLNMNYLYNFEDIFYSGQHIYGLSIEFGYRFGI